MDKHPKDYFVPNFGVDHDIITTQANFKKAGGKLAQLDSIPACNSADFPKCLGAETAADHKLQKDMDKHPKDYFVPNFGVDHDIITTQSNYKKAGGKLVQLNKTSIPACNSDKGCATNTASPWKQRGDPIDDIHNFPAPTIVKTSESALRAYIPPKSLAEIESVPSCNSHTHPGCKDAKTSAPEHLAPLWKTDVELDDNEQVLLESDPICNSWKCSQYLHPKKEGMHPINYGVPDFGVDHDIKSTQEHYSAAEDAKKIPSFDPVNIPPDDYEQEFDLKPIWARGDPGYEKGGVKEKAMDRWLGK